LAFAVAAHLEPEILIVDEVLAVGDMEFQTKCLGKMKDVSQEGRTVLFVSPNMGSLTQLCNKGVLLKGGKIVTEDNIDKVVDYYIGQNSNSVSRINKQITDAQVNQFKEIFMTNFSSEFRTEYRFDEEVVIRVEMYLPKFSENFELAMRLMDKHKRAVFTIHEKLSKYYKGSPIVKLDINVPSKFLTPGFYSWIMCINHPGNMNYDLQEDIANFTILETGSEFSRYDGADYGVVFADYTVKKIDI
jgi:lipopolysaccharide transport system ATP-binding protein